MKYLVIAKASDVGYNAWVPRVPECRASGATLAEATANIEAALRAHLASNGTESGVLEVVVIEDVWQSRKLGDGLDESYNELARNVPVEELELLLNLEEKQLIPFEDVIREFEALEQKGA